MINRSVLTALSFFLFILVSCKKDGSIPQIPPNEDPAFVVVLNKVYMPRNKIDSAIATWEVGGQKQTVKLQLSNDTLKADIKEFREGNGKLILHLFSSIKFQNQYLSQWFHEKQITVQHNRRSIFNGPTGFHDLQWKPRVLLKDGESRHVALVALRPDDAYFLVKNLAAGVLKVTVGRAYWNTVAGVRQVGGGEWKCSTGCTDANHNIENSEFFHFLPTQIGTKPWNHIEIVILYETDRWGGGPALAMDHEF